MADRGIDLDRHYYHPWSDGQSAPHQSPVIDSINVTFGHPMQNAHDYFGALYLAAREEAKGLVMPQDIERCIDAIERAKKRKTEAEDEATHGQTDTH